MATGLSPQVVTETLYALCVATEPAWRPTEVHVITTAEGAERLKLTLLSDDPGWFARLCGDYDLDGIAFDEQHLHAIEAPDGNTLDDIRTKEDNRIAADDISEQVRRFTEDDDTALHVSIAGGRKTMGFYAGYALSLYGRSQDRLSHVLVSPPFESNQEFYYPTPYSKVIYSSGPNGQPMDTRHATVTLAEIPFVRLRHGIPRSLQTGKSGLTEVVAAAQRELGPPTLVLEVVNRRLLAGGAEVNLPPVEFAFYSWMAGVAGEGAGALSCPTDGVADKKYAEAFMSIYRVVTGPMADDERTYHALIEGMEKNFFERTKSRVNRKLNEQIGPVGARPYLVQRFGRRPHWTHGLGLKPESISFTNSGEK